jgi:hypothetical protein
MKMNRTSKDESEIEHQMNPINRKDIQDIENRVSNRINENEEKNNNESNQAFTLDYVEKSSPFVPNEEVLLVLVHTKNNKKYFVHVHQEGKIERQVIKSRIILDNHVESNKKKLDLQEKLIK